VILNNKGFWLKNNQEKVKIVKNLKADKNKYNN
jgi:hypothetical protein